MSEYRIRSTGEVKTQGQIRSMHPNVSLPKVWNASVNETLGIDPVLASPQPAPSADYKNVVRNGVEQDANGNWVHAWTEQDMFTEYTEEVTDDQGVTTTNVVTVQDQIDAYEAKRAAERRATMACTPRQARLALSSQGLLADVEAAVTAAGEAARLEWDYATTVERTSPLISSMRGPLGMTDQDLDNLFDLAVTL